MSGPRLRLIMALQAASVLAWSIPAATHSAAAQSTISHDAIYTAGQGLGAAAATDATSALPLVDPEMLPPSVLLRSNAAPANLGRPGTTVVGAAEPEVTPEVSSQAAGTYSPLPIAPYSTAGAYAQTDDLQHGPAATAVTAYPWRATGKLYFNIAGKPFACSGALIAPGLLLTAAHCVFEYGANKPAGWHSDLVFVPALADAARFGSWTARTEWIPGVYYRGTDKCQVRGVVCNNDVAVLVMNKNGSGLLPGRRVGWYPYGWNGYSYVKSFGGALLSHITQLGYPQALDFGIRMERTDGIGAMYNPGDGLYNTVLGSAQTGGSSGGPWMVNFGARPKITGRASLGHANRSDVVVGVTSWGYSTLGTNTQGSSWFGQNAQFPGEYTDSHGVYRGAGNIASLVSSACSAAFDHC